MVTDGGGAVYIGTNNEVPAPSMLNVKSSGTDVGIKIFNNTATHYTAIGSQATTGTTLIKGTSSGMTLQLDEDSDGAQFIPSKTSHIDLGDHNAKWRTLFVDELYAETLVAQDVMATIGGRIMVAPTSKLEADLADLSIYHIEEDGSDNTKLHIYAQSVNTALDVTGASIKITDVSGATEINDNNWTVESVTRSVSTTITGITLPDSNSDPMIIIAVDDVDSLRLLEQPSGFVVTITGVVGTTQLNDAEWSGQNVLGAIRIAWRFNNGLLDYTELEDYVSGGTVTCKTTNYITIDSNDNSLSGNDAISAYTSGGVIHPRTLKLSHNSFAVGEYLMMRNSPAGAPQQEVVKVETIDGGTSHTISSMAGTPGNYQAEHPTRTLLTRLTVSSSHGLSDKDWITISGTDGTPFDPSTPGYDGVYQIGYSSTGTNYPTTVQFDISPAFIDDQSSGSTLTSAPYSYNVTRNSDGTGLNNWYQGDAIVSLGKAVGDGWLELTSTSTTMQELGPVMTINRRSATTNWHDVEPIVAIGNLESYLDYSSNTPGFAIGDDISAGATVGKKFMSADATSGIRLNNIDLNLYNSAGANVHTVNLSSDGNLTMGSNIASVETTSFKFFSNDETYNTEAFTAGDVMFGSNSTAKGNLLWDDDANSTSGALKIRSGTDDTHVFNADGSGHLGLYKDDSGNKGLSWAWNVATQKYEFTFRGTIYNASDEEIAGTGMNWRGNWTTNGVGTAYSINDGVHYNGSSYMCNAVIASSTEDLTSTGYPSQSAYWDLMASAGTGDNAVTLNISTSDQAFLYAGDGTLQNDNAYIVITPNAQNGTGSVTITPTNLIRSSTSASSGLLSSVAANTAVYMHEADFNTVRGSDNSVQVTMVYDGITDYTNVYRLQDGQDGIASDTSLTIFSDNPTHTFPASPEGVVQGGDYADGTSKIYFFDGATQIFYNTGTNYPYYQVSDVNVDSQTDIDVTLLNVGTTEKYNTIVPSNFDAGVSSALNKIAITYYKDASTTLTGYSKMLSYSKSLAGVDSKNIQVLVDRQIVAYSSVGILNPPDAAQDVTITVNNNNLDLVADVVWSYSPDISACATESDGSFSQNDEVVLDVSDAAFEQCTVTATLDGYSDSVTIITAEESGALLTSTVYYNDQSDETYPLNICSTIGKWSWLDTLGGTAHTDSVEAASWSECNYLKLNKSGSGGYNSGSPVEHDYTDVFTQLKGTEFTIKFTRDINNYAIMEVTDLIGPPTTTYDQWVFKLKLLYYTGVPCGSFNTGTDVTVNFNSPSPGGNAISGYLTNETHIIGCDLTGVPFGGQLATATGLFKVFDGTTDVTDLDNCVFSEVSAGTNCTGTIDADTGAYSLDTLAAGTNVQAIYTVRVTYTSPYANGLYAGEVTTVDKTFSITKSITGATGATGFIYMITPVSGTTIQNSAGSLRLKATKVEGGVGESSLSSGVIFMYNDSGVALDASQSGVTEGTGGTDAKYDAVLDGTFIDGSHVVYLKDGSLNVLDTISLVDVTDGGDSIAGAITSDNGLAWTGSLAGNDFDPAPTVCTLTCTFYQGGLDVGTRTAQVTRTGLTLNASDGTGTIDGLTFTSAPGGGKTCTVTFTHVTTGATVSETLYVVTTGFAQGTFPYTVDTGVGAEGDPEHLMAGGITLASSSVSNYEEGNISMAATNYNLVDWIRLDRFDADGVDRKVWLEGIFEHDIIRMWTPGQEDQNYTGEVANNGIYNHLEDADTYMDLNITSIGTAGAIGANVIIKMMPMETYAPAIITLSNEAHIFAADATGQVHSSSVDLVCKVIRNNVDVTHLYIWSYGDNPYDGGDYLGDTENVKGDNTQTGITWDGTWEVNSGIGSFPGNNPPGVLYNIMLETATGSAELKINAYSISTSHYGPHLDRVMSLGKSLDGYSLSFSGSQIFSFENEYSQTALPSSLVLNYTYSGGATTVTAGDFTGSDYLDTFVPGGSGAAQSGQITLTYSIVDSYPLTLTFTSPDDSNVKDTITIQRVNSAPQVLLNAPYNNLVNKTVDVQPSALGHYGMYDAAGTGTATTDWGTIERIKFHIQDKNGETWTGFYSNAAVGQYFAFQPTYSSNEAYFKITAISSTATVYTFSVQFQNLQNYEANPQAHSVNETVNFLWNPSLLGLQGEDGSDGSDALATTIPDHIFDEAPPNDYIGMVSSPDFFGYANNGTWNTYMDNQGDFYLKGNNAVGSGYSGIAWDASEENLIINGTIHIGNPGEQDVNAMNTDNLPEWILEGDVDDAITTIDGGKIQTGTLFANQIEMGVLNLVYPMQVRWPNLSNADGGWTVNTYSYDPLDVPDGWILVTDQNGDSTCGFKQYTEDQSAGAPILLRANYTEGDAGSSYVQMFTNEFLVDPSNDYVVSYEIHVHSNATSENRDQLYSGVYLYDVVGGNHATTTPSNFINSSGEEVSSAAYGNSVKSWFYSDNEPYDGVWRSVKFMIFGTGSTVSSRAGKAGVGVDPLFSYRNMNCLMRPTNVAARLQFKLRKGHPSYPQSQNTTPTYIYIRGLKCIPVDGATVIDGGEIQTGLIKSVDDSTYFDLVNAQIVLDHPTTVGGGKTILSSETISRRGYDFPIKIYSGLHMGWMTDNGANMTGTESWPAGTIAMSNNFGYSGGSAYFSEEIRSPIVGYWLCNAPCSYPSTVPLGRKLIFSMQPITSTSETQFSNWNGTTASGGGTWEVMPGYVDSGSQAYTSMYLHTGTWNADLAAIQGFQYGSGANSINLRSCVQTHLTNGEAYFMSIPAETVVNWLTLFGMVLQANDAVYVNYTISVKVDIWEVDEDA